MNSILTRIGMAALLGTSILLTGCNAGDGADTNATGGADTSGGANANADGGTDANTSDDAKLALIEKPAVGDIYAAELSEFTVNEFTDSDGKPITPAYGLMKVVEVDADKVVVITEAAAFGTKELSQQDILGDLKDITFDEEERIDIVLSQLRKAYESGKVYEVRR
ncbi:MAG TPA: hypothetical protein VK325_00430 [Pseudoxanthomonas sp.]|nr:hypothetical protein [Pseudoxanthomonas sp.]